MIETKKAWSKAVTQVAEEFPLTPCQILSGKVPFGLRGSLYRNGPARLERGGVSVGHWFDGDGAILGVHFTNSDVQAVYRYVKTTGYQQESLANKFLFPNYGMTVPGPFWRSWGKEVKNAANTSVLALSDRLLALWEGANPYALDRETLETIGIDNLSWLAAAETFSAHPKVDYDTGDIYNFGLNIGANASLNLYHCDATGKLLKKGGIALKGVPMLHDFVMAGSYLVFFIPPVRLQLLPIMLGTRSFSDSMQWKPELGTEILVFDRVTLSLVSRYTTDAWFQWHFVNGCVDNDGAILIEFLRFDDFQTNQNLQEFITGKIKTPAKGTLWQVRLQPSTAKIIGREQLVELDCEFPAVKPHEVGKSWDCTYLAIQREGANIVEELFGAIACYEHKTGKLSIADMGENRYPSEPLYVASRENPEKGWLLTVVYDGNDHSSEVRIYESDRLTEEPVCRLGLPSVIPFGFHGTWKNKA